MEHPDFCASGKITSGIIARMVQLVRGNLMASELLKQMHWTEMLRLALKLLTGWFIINSLGTEGLFVSPFTITSMKRLA